MEQGSRIITSTDNGEEEELPEDGIIYKQAVTAKKTRQKRRTKEQIERQVKKYSGKGEKKEVIENSGSESDVDKEFEDNLLHATNKYGEKRKKKYTYNEEGIPVEPFHLWDELRTGNFVQGFYREDKDESWDPWLKSMEGKMKEMEKEEAMKQQESDKEESEDEDINSEDEEKEAKQEETKQVITERKLKLSLTEIIKLKEKLISLLGEKSETVNQAIKRYKKEIEIIEKELGKGKESKLPKWKRRKLMGEMEEGGDLVGAESSEDGKEEKRKDLDFWRGSFNSLLEVTGDLVTAGITDIYTEKKADIEFDVQQEELRIIRRKKEEEDKINRNKFGWFYKIIRSEVGTGPSIGPVNMPKSKVEQHGPFLTSEIKEWKKQNFFTQSPEVKIVFKRANDILDSSVQWKTIDNVDLDFISPK